ncbi:MAG: hypothetical protein ACT4PW_11460, partial [Acidimicrobiia bacterium]
PRSARTSTPRPPPTPAPSSSFATPSRTPEDTRNYSAWVRSPGIGGVAVPFTISGNSLVITTPAALPDTVHVVVTGPDGDSKIHSGSAYTYI